MSGSNVELYTNTYCEVATADLSIALALNDQWNSLTEAEKEKYLKVASKLMDLVQYRGEKESSAQPMQWPRNISIGEFVDDLFTDDEVEWRLAEACCAQVAYMMSPKQIAEQKGGSEYKQQLSQEAREILTPYMRFVNPLNGFDKYYETDVVP